MSQNSRYRRVRLSLFISAKEKLRTIPEVFVCTESVLHWDLENRRIWLMVLMCLV